MTTYRVGEAGATVFNAAGEPLCRLRPGQVVIEGTIDTAGSLAAQHAEHEATAKRVRDYPNKKRPPVEDKAVGLLRDGIKRLDRASARIDEARRRIRR